MTPSTTPASPTNPNGSTGPTTAAGKAICARNAVKHQIYSPSITFSTAVEQEEFDSLLSGYTRTYVPSGQPEHDLVLLMAIATYKNIRLERASVQQEALLAGRLRDNLRQDGIEPGDNFDGYLLEAQTTDKVFQDYLRRSRHLTSTINRCSRDLLKLQKDRRHLATLKLQAEMMTGPGGPDAAGDPLAELEAAFPFGPGLPTFGDPALEIAMAEVLRGETGNSAEDSVSAGLASTARGR